MKETKSIASFIIVPEIPLEKFIEIANKSFRNMGKNYGMKIIEMNKNYTKITFIINNKERFQFKIKKENYKGLTFWIITYTPDEGRISTSSFKNFMTKRLRELPGITPLWIEPEVISKIIELYGKGTAIATSIHDPLVLSKKALSKIPYEIYEDIENKEYNIFRTIEVRIKAPVTKVKEKLIKIKRAVHVEYIDVVFRFRSQNPGPAEVLLNENAFIGVTVKTDNANVTKTLWNKILTCVVERESNILSKLYRSLPKYEEVKLLNATLTALVEPGKPVTIAIKPPKGSEITKTDIMAYAMALIYGTKGIKGYFFYGKKINEHENSIELTIFDGLHGGSYYVNVYLDRIVITPLLGATIGGLLSLYRFTREHFNWNAEII